MSEHGALLKLPKQYHRAPRLPKTVPVLAASYTGDEHTHQELELKPIGKFPGIHTASSVGINRSRDGGAQVGHQVELVVNNAFNTPNNMLVALEIALSVIGRPRQLFHT